MNLKPIRITIIAVTIMMTTATFASAGVAVSEPNGKADFTAGEIDSEFASAASFSFAFPLWKNLATQFSGMRGDINNNEMLGGSVQLFFRNSDTGMLGINSSYAEIDKKGIKRLGFEGELYFGSVTLTNYMGIQSGEVENKGFLSDDAGYFLASANYYAVENLKLTAGVSRSDGDNRVFTNIEYLTPVDGLALYVDGATGSDDYEHIAGGVKVYLGPKKSLIKRHREDSLGNSLFKSLSESLNAVSYN